MRIYEVVYATPQQQRRAQQAQAVTQRLLSLATPPAIINAQAQPFGHLLQRKRKKPHPTIQQVTATQSPLPAIQRDKIDRLAGKFSRGEAALQRKVSDDDIVMAMRRVDAEKDSQQKMPKTAGSAVTTQSKFQPKLN